MEYTWIKASNQPPKAGVYYVICRALRDIVDIFEPEKVLLEKGKIEFQTGYWDGAEWYAEVESDFGYQQYEVLAWCRVHYPPIPEWAKDDTRCYFGTNCSWNGESWDMEETV